jgi:hypothetical protein
MKIELTRCKKNGSDWSPVICLCGLNARFHILYCPSQGFMSRINIEGNTEQSNNKRSDYNGCHDGG